MLRGGLLVRSVLFVFAALASCATSKEQMAERRFRDSGCPVVPPIPSRGPRARSCTLSESSPAAKRLPFGPDVETGLYCLWNQYAGPDWPLPAEAMLARSVDALVAELPGLHVTRRDGQTVVGGTTAELRLAHAADLDGLTHELLLVAELVRTQVGADAIAEHGDPEHLLLRGAIRGLAWPNALYVDAPLVVLVDKDTGSGSEIFAATMRAAGRAVLVGAPTAGVAVAQFQWKLPSGAQLRVAIAGLRAGDGSEIQGHAFVPDIAAAPAVSDDGDATLALALDLLARTDGKSRAALLRAAGARPAP